MDAWANLHLLGQSVTFLARSPRSARRRRAAPDGDGGAKGNTLLYCCTPTPHVWCVSNVTYGQVLEEDARSTARGAKLSKDRKLQGKSLLSLLGEDPEFGQNPKAIYKRIHHTSTETAFEIICSH